MNALKHAPRNTAWRRPPAPLHPRSSSPLPLTLDDASVIVISSLAEPSSPPHDADASSRFIAHPTQHRLPPAWPLYKSQSIAL